ncbi:MAG: alpha/beta fold hydrolase, partial [Solirubrobacterales bacterium]|nr:alpha/beta fold hydrolase [Solirubrobacterales bacterium]
AGIRAGDRASAALGLRGGARTLRAAGRTLSGVAPPDRRNAFLRTVRGVIGPRGQLATMAPYEELWNAVPVLIIWGERDTILPHQQALLMPGARLVLVEDAGHLPHLTHAQAVAEEVRLFMLRSDAEPPLRQVHVSEARSSLASP